MSSDIAISVKSLSKSYHIYDKPRDRLLQMFLRKGKTLYRNFWALQDVSFEVARGETVGIIGRNGSGKSTLLQIICGTLNPSNGEVEANGRIAALLELGAGFNPEFTGRENVYISATLYGLTHAQVDERLSAITAFADIGDFIDQPVKAYSSGMFVRLAFAVIAHVDADVLIVDEALAVGDAFFTQKCMRFLRDFMRTGTVLFVSHDTAAVKALCTRAIWLQNGKVVASGPAKQVCDGYLGEMIEAGQGTSASRPAEDLVVDPEPHAMPAQDWDGPLAEESDEGRAYFLPFNARSSFFGAGGARITDAAFFDGQGNRLKSTTPFGRVEFRVAVQAEVEVTAPIVGFFIRDRLGQTLFGSNTFVSTVKTRTAIRSGSSTTACFDFVLPALPNGDYTVTVSVADGTQDEHVQLHWLHDAMIIKTQGIHDLSGLVGVPMNEIRFEAANAASRTDPS